MHDRSAYRSAELVAFQRAGFCREIITCVEEVIPDELEQITMELICSRFGHAAHSGRRSVLSIDSASRDLEFLEGIRKRQRHIGAGHEIDVTGAIQRVVHGITQRTSNLNVWFQRSVISPKQVNELTLGFARFKFYFTYIDSNPDGLPRFTFNNATAHYVNQPHAIRWLNTPQIIDNFSWVKGSHQWKFGGNVRFYQQNNQNGGGQNNTVPQISLSSTINPPGAGFNLPALASGSNPGIASADNTRLLSTINDLLGIPAQLRANFLANLNTDSFIPSRTSDYYSVWATGERLKQFNAYVQDEWRARRNLTVNYGVRWEYNKPPTESSQPIFVPDRLVDGSQGPITFIRARRVGHVRTSPPLRRDSGLAAN